MLDAALLRSYPLCVLMIRFDSVIRFDYYSPLLLLAAGLLQLGASL